MVELNELLRLMENHKNVRNAGMAGHIDHGKTSASDCLLAYCGLIAPFLAGQVRFLDYLDVEQKRGITIKTAAISLLVKLDKERYILNFIDTPGHVDFSGKVSRALRLMDGVIIVVDAVEGIMAQTEAYLKLALEEHVRPILYINKIDRLISELSMTPFQIQSKFEEIIVGFNDLIDMFGYDYQKKAWKVDPKKDTVIFGCAVGCWGFTLNDVIKRGLKFSDIVKMFEENPDLLRKTLRLGKLFAKIIYEKIPNPIEAQKYRAKYLWVNDNISRSIIRGEKEGTTIFYVSKCIIEAGRIFAIGRVFSGRVRRREYICLNTRENRKIDAVHVLLGNTSKYVKSIPIGNVFGAFIHARPGETYATEYINGYFKVPTYIAVPVVFVAVEPKKAGEFEKLMKELEILRIEDPNLAYEVNKETGEILLGGIGELHLEIILKQLSDKMEIYYSEPMIAYREILISRARIEEKGIAVSLTPIIDDEVLRNTLAGSLPNARGGNIIIIEGLSLDEKDVLESIIANALKNGPLVGEPIIGAKIEIEKKASNQQKIDINDIIVVFSKAIALAKTDIAEPYYEFEISTKTDYVGGMTAEINRRGGKVNSMDAAAGGLIKIRGIIPVRTSLGLPSVLRSIAHGSAFIQLKFFNYLIAKDKARENVLREIRLRKGLD